MMMMCVYVRERNKGKIGKNRDRQICKQIKGGWERWID